MNEQRPQRLPCITSHPQRQKLRAACRRLVYPDLKHSRPAPFTFKQLAKLLGTNTARVHHIANSKWHQVRVTIAEYSVVIALDAVKTHAGKVTATELRKLESAQSHLIKAARDLEYVARSIARRRRVVREGPRG